MQVTQQQAELMQHALGIHENNRTSNRNYFLASGRDEECWDLMVGAGFATSQPAPSWVGGGTVFTVTEAGKAVALAMLPPPPKVKRNNNYLRYLDGDYCDSFGEFLIGNRLPEIETRTEGVKTEYRMYRETRCDYYLSLTRDVEGEWCATRKAAKASYKLALKSARDKRKQNRREDDTAAIH